MKKVIKVVAVFLSIVLIGVIGFKHRGTEKNIQLSEIGDVFEAEEFSHLPIAIQRYIEHCGYIGIPKMSYLKMKYRDVDFMQGRKN